MVTMLGCDILPAECASRLKRARTSGSCSAAKTSARSSYLPMVPSELKPPFLPGERLSLPQAVPSPREEVRNGRHGDAVEHRLQRLVRLAGEREDGADLDCRDHDPDHGEQQPELLPEGLERH